MTNGSDYIEFLSMQPPFDYAEFMKSLTKGTHLNISTLPIQDEELIPVDENGIPIRNTNDFKIK